MAETGTTDEKQKESLTLQILDKVGALMTAAFGLVAALAWNDAIKSLISIYLTPDTALRGQLLYALIVTVIAVIAGVAVAAATSRVSRRIRREKKTNPPPPTKGSTGSTGAV